MCHCLHFSSELPRPSVTIVHSERMRYRLLTKLAQSAFSFPLQRHTHPSRTEDTQLSAKTTTPFAGMTMLAEAGKPCIGTPEATMPPPFPATIGLTQLS